MCIVGYPYGQKGYKVFNLVTQEFIVSRDVIFHEKYFPFHLNKRSTLFELPSFFLPTSTEVAQQAPIPTTSTTPNPEFTRDTSSKDMDNNNNEDVPTPHAIVLDNNNTQDASRRSTRLHHPPSYLSDYVCTITIW